MNKIIGLKHWDEKPRAGKIIDTLLILSFLAFIGTAVWAIFFKVW